MLGLYLLAFDVFHSHLLLLHSLYNTCCFLFTVRATAVATTHRLSPSVFHYGCQSILAGSGKKTSKACTKMSRADKKRCLNKHLPSCEVLHVLFGCFQFLRYSASFDVFALLVRFLVVFRISRYFATFSYFPQMPPLSSTPQVARFFSTHPIAFAFSFPFYLLSNYAN